MTEDTASAKTPKQWHINDDVARWELVLPDEARRRALNIASIIDALQKTRYEKARKQLVPGGRRTSVASGAIGLGNIHGTVHIHVRRPVSALRYLNRSIHAAVSDTVRPWGRNEWMWSSVIQARKSSIARSRSNGLLTRFHLLIQSCVNRRVA